MAKQQESHIFTGMQRDVSISKHPAQFIYEGQNVRLTAREGDTLLSITNEKGTLDTGITITGNYLGHSMLNQYLVVFSSDGNRSYIVRIDLSTTPLTAKVLYDGEQIFSKPIKAIVSFESKMIQKVYWTDGEHQPRMINISPDNDDRIDTYTSQSFDFIQDLMLEETVTVTKMLGATGVFAPGTLQYSFTYYKKYGQETNIFYTTPLLYTSHKDRGGSPEDKVENAFKITITNVDDSFDYLRIYSIQRTSINAVPICKRVQDIEIASMDKDNNGKRYTSYIDTGNNGDSVDPTELLYKGGEEITAKTIEQKDGTLFLGNINITRKNINELKSLIEKTVINPAVSRTIYPTVVTTGNNNSYAYASQLTAYSSPDMTKSVPCGGFKRGDVYRCGVQFQYKNGKWSEPFFIADKKVLNHPVDSGSFVTLPALQGTLTQSLGYKLVNQYNYKKVRAVVVFPDAQDRATICQGIANPTLYTEEQRVNNKSLYAQASWFFRCPMVNYVGYDNALKNGTYAPFYGKKDACLPYTSRQINSQDPVEGGVAFDPDYFSTSGFGYEIRQVEIQGDYKDENKFRVDTSMLTLNSPDIEFNDQLSTMNFAGFRGRKVGNISIAKTFSDIDIQTETPTISNKGSGFQRKSFVKEDNYGIISGLFYDDYIVDDNIGDDNRLGSYPEQIASAKWLIYPWQGTGSLNNDINRPADKGVATSKLKKKAISNLRYGNTTYNSSSLIADMTLEGDPQLYSNEEATIIKQNNNIYQGNIDTSIMPDNADGLYLCLDSYKPLFHDDWVTWLWYDVDTSFTSNTWFKTWSSSPDISKYNGIKKWQVNAGSHEWEDTRTEDNIGDEFVDIVMKKNAVRMKYKSTPHIVFTTQTSIFSENSSLPVVELYNPGITENSTTIFGGKSPDALKANVWIPCGEPVTINTDKDTVFGYDYGDTYYQRYDCLKTYPFTHEDLNQIVEIGSFMVETRVNIDGRYDRNRGQLNNLNMSPQNFNLLNPVYSQKDNFFSYRILDEDFYKNVYFPNQVTWTKEKQSGADVDLWANVTLSSTYDIEGSKGEITSLNTWKDTLYCFQNKGISNILFNSRVQIPTSDNNPIEISNNYKVDGYRYLSDGIGCNSQWLIKETPSGIYFVDSIGGHLCQINEGLKDITQQCNMTTWFKDHGSNIEKVVYDNINHDVYLVRGADLSLCYSEKLEQFTGLYDYDSINLIETYDSHVFTLRLGKLYYMFEGDYCNFFGTNKSWGLTFISNGIGNNTALVDKTFTNLEFRSCVEGDGTWNENQFTPLLPFDYLETWNEYQRGVAYLKNLRGHKSFLHHTRDKDASLKRKFRIWHCDIPRDNASYRKGTSSTFDASFDFTFQDSVTEKNSHPLDRMRNPWLMVKLQKNAAAEGEVLHRTEVHDLQMIYFS